MTWRIPGTPRFDCIICGEPTDECVLCQTSPLGAFLSPRKGECAAPHCRTCTQKLHELYRGVA